MLHHLPCAVSRLLAVFFDRLTKRDPHDGLSEIALCHSQNGVGLCRVKWSMQLVRPSQAFKNT